MKTVLQLVLLAVGVASAAFSASAAKIVVAEGDYAIDSAAKIDEVRASDGIDIASGATVTYSDASNALFLNVPVTGAGTFKATGGKKLVLEADSRDFTGSWDITDTTTAVSNRYGLGSSATTRAKFTRSDASNSFMLWFGGNGLTNDVPILLMSAGAWPLKENVAELRDKTKVAVFNGKITKNTALSLCCYPAIYNGGTGSNGGSITVQPLNNSADNYATGMSGQWVRFGGQLCDGSGTVTLDGGNNAVVDYYLEKAGNTFGACIHLKRAYLHCGAENVLKAGNYSGSHPTNYRIDLGEKYATTQWKTSVVDLNGYNQKCSVIRSYWTPAAEDGETYRTQVISTNGPATVTMTYGGSVTTCTRYEGEVSVDWQGTGSYRLANLVSTSTGELKATSGTVELKQNGGWSGDAVVTNADAKIVVSSARGFTGGTSRVTVSDGGRFEIAATGVAQLGTLAIGANGVVDIADGATVSATELDINGTSIPSGTYTAAGLAAAGYGDYVTGDGKIIVGAAAAVSGTSPFDDLIFDLSLPTVTAQATADDLQDTLTYSAVTQPRPTTVVTYDPSKDATGYAAFGTPAPLSIATRTDIDEPYYYKQNVTTSGNVLVFPKNVASDANDVKAAYSTPVLWNGFSQLTGSNLTVRIRFKWSGNYVQGGNWSYDQYLFQIVNLDDKTSICNATLESVPPTSACSSAYLRGGIGGTAAAGSTQNVINDMASTDTWCDTIWVFENTSDGKSRVTIYAAISTTTGLRTGSLTCSSQMTIPSSGNIALALGAPYGHFSTYGTSTGNTKWRKLATESEWPVYAGFAGEISRFQVFNRALTEAEAHAVFTDGGAGMTMRIGSLNGSADEFAASDDAGIEANFNARTMLPHQFRKALDAANPSVTITCPFRSEESGLTRYLTIGAQREDVMAAPLEVRLNGKLVDTLTFGEERVKTLYVKGNYLKANGDGNIVLTLTRPAPVSGTLLLDAIQLSGGWAAGIRDGKSNDWCFKPAADYAYSSYSHLYRGVIGNSRNLGLAPEALYGLKNDMVTWYFSDHTLVFDLPAEAVAGESVTVTFTLGLTYLNDDAELDVFLNGSATPLLHIGPDAGGSMQSFDIVLPRANLKAGLNTIKLSNVGTTFRTSAQYNSISFDNFKLTVEDPTAQRSGFMLFIQ